MIQWRKVIVAGVAGFACGNIFSHLKKYPDVVWSIAPLSVTAGVTGSLLGIVVASYRNQPKYIYTISLGTNFTLAMVSFLGIRYWIIKVLDEQSYWSNIESKYFIASGTSGTVIGALFTTLSRSTIKSVLCNSMGGLCIGMIGQIAYNHFELWRKQKAIEIHYPELANNNKSSWSFEKFGIKWLEFWHRSSKAGEIEANIALIEECIKEEKFKLLKLNEKLTQHGYTITGIEEVDQREYK